jgi:hypothetical protein
VEALFEAATQAAIAMEENSTSLALLQPAQAQVDPASPAAQIGKELVSVFQNVLSQLPSSSSTSWQHLAQAASCSPSLLAGDLKVLQPVVQATLT